MTKHRVNFDITTGQLNQVRKLQAETGNSLSEIVRKSIELYLLVHSAQQGGEQILLATKGQYERQLLIV